MPAIAPDGIRHLFANLLKTDVEGDSSNPYYIGFGKSDLWDTEDTVPVPTRTKYDEMLARENLQSVKQINDQSLVVPRTNWSSGTIYDAWDDQQAGYPTRPYYVLTEDNHVYICLKQALDDNGSPVVSSVKPNYSDESASIEEEFETSDGYVWKFLYKLSAINASKFLSASFLPVEKVEWTSLGDSASLNPDQLDQLVIQQNAVAGAIYSVELISGGSGYTNPSVTITGDGSGATATATVSNGIITKIEMDTYGSGYNIANIVITDAAGSAASARPKIAPVDGFGADATKDLKSSSVMLNSVVAADENDFTVENDFRQVTVLQNIEAFSGGAFTDLTGRALTGLQLTDTPSAGSFTVDNTIVGDNTGAKAYIDYIDGDTVYVHQNENTGFLQFSGTEPVSEENGNGSGTLISIVNPEFDRHSGSILYLENRVRIIRSEAQQEDVKVVITL